MRIAVVNATDSLGGAGLIAKDVARGMVARGHDVLFVCTDDQRGRSFDDDLGCDVARVSGGLRSPLAHYLNPIAVAGLAAELSRFEPDVVNFHNVNLRSFSAASLLVSRRVATAWTLHDVWPVCMTGWPEPPDCQGMHRGCANCPTWPDWQSRLNRRLKDAFFAASQLTVVCPSDWMAHTVSSSALGNHRTAIIRNGVDTDLFARHDGVRQDLGFTDEIVVMFAGGRRVSGTSPAYRKGWEYLRAALAQLADPRVVLLYVGDKIDLGADFPVPVKFTGGVDRTEMPRFYSAADLAVFPTLGDNAPLGVLEAMSVGVPIVASRVGGVPEVVVDGTSAALCPPRDAAALANCLRAVCDDADRRTRMVQAASQRLARDLTLDRMVDGYEGLFFGLSD